MRIYLSNHSSPELHYLAGKFGKIGWLLTPEGLKVCKPRHWLPLAFDNGAFSAYQNETEWDAKAWIDMVEKIAKEKIKPEWVLIPDKVGDARETLKMFFIYRMYASKHGWPIAYAVQDGMIPQDVPDSVDVIFIGGTDSFKWKSIPMWRQAFPDKILHVGRVNSLEKLVICEKNEVDSVDGTYWFRFKKSDVWCAELEYFFSGEHKKQGELFSEGAVNG